MHDKNGQPLAADDVVYVECRVKELYGGEEYCNVSLETKEVMFPGEQKSYIALNSRQVAKSIHPILPIVDLSHVAVQDQPRSSEEEAALKHRETFSLQEHLKTLPTPAVGDPTTDAHMKDREFPYPLSDSERERVSLANLSEHVGPSSDDFGLGERLKQQPPTDKAANEAAAEDEQSAAEQRLEEATQQLASAEKPASDACALDECEGLDAREIV